MPYSRNVKEYRNKEMFRNDLQTNLGTYNL